VRLAARLTGWDVDILTPPEFQAGIQRLDQTLKLIPGITQEHVDKIIALGLIDVRDIDEVGDSPLMEELGLDAATAVTAVERCGAEAKIVAVEQEVKKSAEAKAKAADRAALAGAARSASAAAAENPFRAALARAGSNGGEESAVADSEPLSMPGAMESAAGGAPEVVTHNERIGSSSDELSPEEQAIQGMTAASGDRKELDDEDGDTAALAEGRIEPPGSSRTESGVSDG